MRLFQQLTVWLLLFTALVTATTCNYPPKNDVSMPKEEQVVGENGIKVDDEFYQFFKVYGGVDSLGHPLTPRMSVDGWQVQYFDNGRLEYHPENEPAYQVTVGWLGELLNRRRPPIPAPSIPHHNNKNRRYYGETGHTISGDFLDYFDAHGGSVRFGLPISEPFILNGQITQDLQSARFFWTLDTNPPVTLENTGLVHLKAIGLPEKN